MIEKLNLFSFCISFLNPFLFISLIIYQIKQIFKVSRIQYFQKLVSYLIQIRLKLNILDMKIFYL